MILKASNVQHEVAIGSEPLILLKNINLSIKAGESVAIIGASGSGKTTLLGMLAGLDTPSSGSVYINNTDITPLTEAQRAKIRAQNIAFVFQNFQLLGSLTALENVSLPLEVHNKPNAKKQAAVFLEKVGLQERLHHYPKQLSGGEQQRVALARAFACQAPLLFADEPTGNLDAKTGKTIEDLLFKLNEEFNTTLILVTHDNALAQRCSRILRMDTGVLCEQNTHTQDTYNENKH